MGGEGVVASFRDGPAAGASERPGTPGFGALDAQIDPSVGRVVGHRRGVGFKTGRISRRQLAVVLVGVF
jgi:hypothetical protein